MCVKCVCVTAFSCGSCGVLGDWHECYQISVWRGGLAVTVSYSMCVRDTHIVIGGIFNCSDAQHQH